MSKRASGWILTMGIVAAACMAQATVRIKADNTNNLNSTSSWVGATVPNLYDVAQWTNTVTGANAVLLGTNASYMGIWIVNPGGAVAIGGANILTNGFMGIDMSAATVDLTITNANFTLLDYVGQVWNVTNSRTLTVSPTLLARNAGTTLGIQGAGTVVSANLTNDTTGIIGPWVRYGTGTATKYAAAAAGVISGYTGIAAASAANVTDTTGAANYEVAAVGTVGTSAAFNTLRYTGAGGTIAGDFKANGLLNAGSGALTCSGNATVGASKELVLTTPDTTRQITLSGVIGDNGGGASGVTVTGGGMVNLTGNNTYSGPTVISAGMIQVSKTNALGSTAGNTVIYVNGSSTAGGALRLSGGITLAEPITFVGTGDGAPWNSALYVPGGGGTNTLAGPITIAMSSGVRLTASGAGTALNINGPVTRTSSANTLILGAGGLGGVLTVNTPINNNGGNINIHNGPGLVRFNAAGCNIGTLAAQTGQTVQLGVSDAFVSSASLQVGGANNTSGDQARGTFDMNGFSQTFNAFIGDGVVGEPFTLRVVTNSASTLSVLTIGSGGSGGTFNGIIDGNILLVKNSTGTEILCGPNRYTGGTTVNGGVLVLSNAVNHGSLTVNGGTFRLPTALTVNGTLSGTGGLIDTLAGSVLTVNQTTNSFFAGSITNAGSLVKSGPGSLVLSGFNTFSGGTAVSQGTLLFDKVTSKPSAGGVVVSAGANLGLGLGGVGGFTSADVDTLWSGAMSGVTLDATSLIGIDTSVTDVTYAASQSTRGLVKTGTNMLSFTGANTYSGGTYIQAGVLAIPTTASLPGWNAGGSYWVSRDAGLAVGNAVSDDDFATIRGTGNFADGGCIGFDTTLSNRTYTGIISNTVNGALGLVKVGTNTLTLTGTNTYDGNTFINGGMVVIKSSSAFGSTNGYAVVNRVGGTNSIFTDSTGQVRLDGSAGNLTVNKNFIINGDQQYSYGGALRSVAGNNAINGRIVLGLSGSGRIGTDAGNLTLNGPILRFNAAANPMLVLNPSTGFLIVSNTVDIGTGLINCHSAGTVVFCATNNTWGSSQIQYGSIARLGVNEGLSYGKRVTIGNPEPGNGLLDLYGYSQTIGGLSEYGTAASKPNNIITNGRPSSLSTLTVNQSSGTIDFFSGRLIGALGLVKAGAANSVLTLAGASTFTGDTGIAGGALVVSNQLALQNSTVNATNASGTVRFGAGLSAFTFGGLAGSVGFGLTNTLGSAVVLTVGSNNASTVFSGVLSGAGGLTKVGAGTLTLSGVNTYSGATTVAQGTLALGCNYALSSLSPITLSGGLLDPGTTVQSLGPLTVAGNSAIALGDGSCTLSFANSSSQTWTGVVNMTGLWTPTAIRVGTGASGLTGDQVHRFSYNGERVWVQVDANGYLWKMSGTLLQLK